MNMDNKLIQQIKAALNTEEDGANLIAVARAAHECEFKLAKIELLLHQTSTAASFRSCVRMLLLGDK